ncbi:MAG: phage tail protein, partial [Burkholderiales bacterium]|nr:phage tail protein [Burkholderiales bacterium]
VVAVIGMSNIKLDSFEIEYTTEELADEVVMSFINPELDWQRDVVRKLAPGVTSPLRSRQLELFGCTAKDQAGRAANLYIATNEFRTRRYKWRMDWEAMPLSRGEVATFSHDLATYDYSGRLVAGSSASALKLERRVPLDTGGSWVTLVKPDGSFATYAVQAGSGDSDTLTLAAPLGFNPGTDPDHPPCDYRWLYGHSPSPGRKVKIDAIRPVSHDTVELTAIDEVPDYYEAEDDGYLYAAPRPAFGVPQISNLQAMEDGVRAGNGYLARVGVTWEVSGDYAMAEIRVSVNGGPLELYGQTQARSFEFNVSDGALLLIEVTAYSSLSRLGSFARATLSKTVNFSALFPPSRPASFGLTGDTFIFAPAPEVDVVGYRIAFHL